METQTHKSQAPVLSQFSETLYGVRCGNSHFTVAFLPGRVALAGSPGHQFFLNTGNLPAVRLHEVFKGPEICIERALLHKETATDQGKFLAAIESLQAQKLIDAHGKRNLREFILKCDCPPRRIKEKLRAMGYAHILPKLDFERYPDELTTTVEAMLMFVAAARGFQEESGEVKTIHPPGGRVLAKQLPRRRSVSHP